jgi:hypothetical protein
VSEASDAILQQKLTLAQDHQKVRINYSVVVTDSQTTASQEKWNKLEQLALLSTPQGSPSTVAGGSMQPTSANGPESNATGESNCTIHYPFSSNETTGAEAHKLPVVI